MPQPLSQRDHELLTMPTIAGQLPVKFENGQSWSNLIGHCGQCHRDLPDEDLRGLVVRQTPHLYSVEAVGACHACMRVTRFTYRLHDDMRITGQKNGRWVTWGAPVKPSLFARLRALLKGE